MSSRRYFVGTAAALVVTAGIGGFLLARYLSPANAYAEEILACHAANTGETIMLLRHVEPEDIPKWHESMLLLHKLWLHQAIAALPEANPELANKALRWIDSYCAEHDCSTQDPEIARSLEQALAQFEAPTHR